MRVRYSTKHTINIAIVFLLLCSLVPSQVAYGSTVEIRYMRSDDIIAGFFNLGTSQSNSLKLCELYYPGSRTCYWGIRVWRIVDETVAPEFSPNVEITSGTPVAQVNRAVDGIGIQSATWACPLTSLNSADRILVRVYQKIIVSDAWINVAATGYARVGWLTEQLGVSQLDSATWTVYYYTERFYDTTKKVTYACFYWGTSTYNSRIENFSWTIAVSKAWYDVSTWTVSLVTRTWSSGTSWSINLLTVSWKDIGDWNFNLVTESWKAITAWTFDLIPHMWHSILWDFVLIVYSVNLPILFVGFAFVFLLAIGIILHYYWEK